MRILLAAALLFSIAAPAQSSKPNHKKEQLRFTLILSRHGVRPPLASPESLSKYSSEPWPTWEVPLGHLTPHGAEALKQMGAWMRLDLAHDGLLPATGCPSDIFLYSDTDERNISSTHATFSAFAPGCTPLPVHTFILGSGTRDPLFLPIPGTFPRPLADRVMDAMRSALGSDPSIALTAKGHPELNELAHILAPDAAHPPATPINNLPVSVIPNPTGDPLVSNHSPLATASSLTEDFLLEYVDAKPMSEVAWGRVDEAAIHRLITLNVANFTYNVRTPLFARTIASNLMGHILSTLDQAAQSPADSTKPLGPAGTKLVYISGHDTNLHAIAGLLDLHWTTDGVRDETPPDSQIVFELWQRRGSPQYTVRILYRAQTLAQLRSARPLTHAHPPSVIPLTPPGCTRPRACPFTTFRNAVSSKLDPTYIQRNLAPTRIAP
jgi:4-phytase/acid phosphatase